MNDFEKRIKVDKDVLYAISKIEEVYRQQSRKLSEEDKEKTIRYMQSLEEEK